MGRDIITELKIKTNSDSKIQIITPSKVIASSLNIPHYSLESLARNLVRRQGWGIASALLSRRLLQNAIQEVIKSQNIAGIAQAFLPTIKDLLKSGINLTCLAENTDERIQQLARVALAYQQQLRQRKLIDAAQLYYQATASVTYQKPYGFYGYFAPSQDEFEFINAIAGDNSILVLPDHNLLPQNHQGWEWLQTQGWISRHTQNRTGNLGSIGELQRCFKAQLPTGVDLQVFPSLEAEVRGILTEVKVLLSQGVTASDVVLVTQEEQLYGEMIIDIAWEYNLPVQINYEISLDQTRIGAWLKLLLEVIRDNFPFETTAKLLAHTVVKYITPKIWAEAREKLPQGLFAWQQLGIDLSLLDFPQDIQPRSWWVQRLQDILTNWEVLEKSKAWGREVLAYYRLQSAFKELAKPEQLVRKHAFIAEIREILSLLTVPAQPGIGGVELHKPTSLLGTKYPHVFVLGSAEGILPKAIADDPILDFYSRKQLVKEGFKITTAVDIAQRESFYFDCLLGIVTHNIIFSYPQLLDRQPTLPSPYLTSLGLKGGAIAKALPLASIELARQVYIHQLPDSLTPQITKALEVETHRYSGGSQNEYGGVIGIEIDPNQNIFSASQLKQLGQCPFKWFSARLLKLKELTEAESEFTAAKRGNLYHRCLELALDQIKTADDLAKSKQQLSQTMAIAQTELNLLQLSDWLAQSQEHLNLLLLNLTSTQFLPPDTEIIARESEFKSCWYGLQIKGRVDRIDRTATGLTVIDYKTSTSPPKGVKDATGKANLDIQLAIYQDAIAQKYPQEIVDTAVYYSVTQQKLIGRSPKEQTQLANFAQQVKSQLKNGSFPVSPDVDRHACNYCPYDLVCRQNENSSNSQ